MQIAITGHRQLSELDPLKSGLHLIFRHLRRLLPSQDWIFYSQLAEGADRLVFQQAVEFARQNPGLSIRLIAQLPLPVPAFLEDFQTTESKEEFTRLLGIADRVILPIQQLDRPYCYREANLRCLEDAALLIALWDGLPARGIGGTAEMVQMVRSRSIPLAWVLAARPETSPELCTSHIEETGKVVKERWENFMPHS